ncbi:hypothetical protein BCR32DRAFT_281068 [Anaeromyces robustus]|uniref:Uncharacterized protein n=1 Tax=Anaeromyces robustus TaxID=1754192 RepID=A0A1Y1X286_9FUNG|nr:hypothetical protein BCR32DRAFT_281068 [Anaeromyces robustus]|eukprot:ORX79812.1 hypothetical protein BCR32DRAFT_281068 [Anaeromyces robustus]
MYFQQLKALLWRNAILKRRGWIITLLEILIPVIITIIVVTSTKIEESDEIFYDRPLTQLNDIEDIAFLIRDHKHSSYPKYDFYFTFPSNFEKDKFLKNFKNSSFFVQNNFTEIEMGKNFTKVDEDICIYENSYCKNYDDNDMNNENNDYDDMNNEYNYNDNSTTENLDMVDNYLTSNYNDNSTTENLDMVDNYLTSNYNDNSTTENLDMVDNYLTSKDKIKYIKNQVRFNIFDNENDIYKYYKENFGRYESSFDTEFIGIIFDSPTSYNIRFYYENDIYDELKDTFFYNTNRNLYLIQILIDKALIKTTVGSDLINYKIQESFMEKDDYIIKPTDGMVRSILPLFLLFYFIPSIGSLLSHLVIEKESGIKESLIIIGLKRSYFWISWAIIYAIIIIISTTITSIVLSISDVFNYINFSVISFVVLLFGLTCCCISFIISTFIHKSKTANTIIVLVIVAFFVLYFVYGITKNKPNIKLFLSFILSPISFIDLFNTFTSLERQQIKFGLFSLIRYPNTRNSFYGLVFTLILYFVLAVYLDDVIPQGNNFHKKWHFFISDYFLKKKKIDNNSNNDNSTNNNNNNSNSSPKENMFIQPDPENLRRAVEVKNIGKCFTVKGDTIEVLKNMSFNGYYDEIFCILGHNGAGKTTLMSIMTGILSATHGEVYYDGVPITGNETEVCQQFGYCPQFDTLNNNLTVGEHIQLFAGIKNIEVDVGEILRDIDLEEKEDNFPKEMSGGQRRKLCIALALLASPKFVFSEEHLGNSFQKEKGLYYVCDHSLYG